jgi:hypothetical protein
VLFHVSISDEDRGLEGCLPDIFVLRGLDAGFAEHFDAVGEAYSGSFA